MGSRLAYTTICHSSHHYSQPKAPARSKERSDVSAAAATAAQSGSAITHGYLYGRRAHNVKERAAAAGLLLENPSQNRESGIAIPLAIGPLHVCTMCAYGRSARCRDMPATYTENATYLGGGALLHRFTFVYETLRNCSLPDLSCLRPKVDWACIT